MVEKLRGTLNRLRRIFSDRTEDAYVARDAAKDDSREEAYAAGQANAYGEAENAVHEEETDERLPLAGGPP